ncbi:MAG: GGDEF domain-containing protein, partial [Gammaproteobacteria bacterium]
MAAKLDMAWISSQLARSRAVAAAVITVDGELVEANDGFRWLLGPAADAGPGAAVAEHFIQPTFARLRDQPAAADGECYVGLITLGEQAGRAWTLQGRVWHRD